MSSGFFSVRRGIAAAKDCREGEVGPYLGKYLPGLEESRAVSGCDFSPSGFQVPFPSGWECLDTGYSIHCPLESSSGPKPGFGVSLNPKGWRQLERAGRTYAPLGRRKVEQNWGREWKGAACKGSHEVSFFSTVYSVAEPETMANPAQVRSLSHLEAVLCLPRA